MDYSALLRNCKTLLSRSSSNEEETLTQLCELLQTQIDYYNWVGFYFANQDTQTLHLKAFAGLPTDHTVIPFGKGICGQVAVSNNPFLVDDVSAQDNYIACDIHVKSELVVPLFVLGENIGQIDIDSNTINAFSNEDVRFLEELNAAIAETLY